MRTYVLIVDGRVRTSPNREAVERLLPHVPPGTAWELEVHYPTGRRHLRSGVGPKL